MTKRSRSSSSLVMWSVYSLTAFFLGGLWAASMSVPLPDILQIAFFRPLQLWPFEGRESLVFFGSSALLVASLFPSLIRRWHPLIAGGVVSLLVMLVAGYLMTAFAHFVLITGLEETLLGPEPPEGRELQAPSVLMTAYLAVEFWIQRFLLLYPAGIAMVLVLRLMLLRAETSSPSETFPAPTTDAANEPPPTGPTNEST